MKINLDSEIQTGDFCIMQGEICMRTSDGRTVILRNGDYWEASTPNKASKISGNVSGKVNWEKLVPGDTCLIGESLFLKILDSDGLNLETGETRSILPETSVWLVEACVE